MKKATIKAVSSIVGGLILFTIVFFIFQSSPSTSEATMTEREAERIASEQFQGEVISIEFDDGRYEIEIEAEDSRYQLKLDAETAEIIELKEKTNPVQVAEVEETTEQVADGVKDSEIETSDSEPASESKSESGQDEKSELDKDETNSHIKQRSNNNVVVSALEAMEIVRGKVPNATLIEFEFDRDDGRYYYEIELQTDDQEIDLEIDAYTGEIIMYSYEQLDDQRKGNSDLITMEEAHQIALAKEPKAVIKEIELDRDEGRYYFEIEMETAKYEIELEIDASTGKITDLEYDD